jgi:hypothetical protein
MHVSVRSKAAWSLVGLAFSLMLVRPATLVESSEDELKSATVWLFVQYSHLEPGTDGAITVGVLGRAAFAQALRRTLEGKTTGGHAVRVVDAKPDMRCCQIVYLATGKTDEIRRALQLTQSLHALTIGESDHFLDIGGAVNLFIADGHITFEASLDALDRCGVTISSNLLKFGQIQSRGRRPAGK